MTVIVGPEGLVGAVFAPRLGDRFEFGVGRISALAVEVIADHHHLLGVETQATPWFSVGQPVRVESTYDDGGHRRSLVAAPHEGRLQVPDAPNVR